MTRRHMTWERRLAEHAEGDGREHQRRALLAAEHSLRSAMALVKTAAVHDDGQRETCRKAYAALVAASDHMMGAICEIERAQDNDDDDDDGKPL